MACSRPLKAYRNLKSGGVMIGRPPYTGSAFLELQLPCGHCDGCKLERSRQWAMRCMHEASLYDENCFVTLTYDDAHLPFGGSLDRAAFPLFMKRLRKAIEPRRVRYYHAGEYGTLYGRPHYHALLFGYDFADKYPWAERHGFRCWRSDELEALWPFGNCELGSVTFSSAAYVARYVVGKDSRPVIGVNVDGEVSELEKEYSTMSRGGRDGHGIGYEWLKRYADEVYKGDGVVVNGRLCKPPRYYDVQVELAEPTFYENVVARRRLKRHKQSLESLEIVNASRVNSLRREF